MKSGKGNMARDIEQQAGRGQGRGRGIGQGLTARGEEGNWGKRARAGICLNNRAGMTAAQPVIGIPRTVGSVNLQRLKEQAERLTNALEDIQRQIKVFEQP